MKRSIPLFLMLLTIAAYGQTVTSSETNSVFESPSTNSVSATNSIFTGGYTHFSGDTQSGKHATLDTNLVWNPLSGNTVTASTDLLSGVKPGGGVSCNFTFADGSGAHVVASFASTSVSTSTTPGGTGGTGTKTGYVHVTADTVNNKHLTVDGNVIWNPLSGNTITTAADLLSGFASGGSLSSILTFANGASVHLVSTFSSVTVTPSFFIGANVETGNVSPSAARYIQTNQGDLFDLAKQAGWNTLRLTQFETWGPNEMDVPYTAQNWVDVFTRAKATGIYLIVLLEESALEKNAIAGASAGQAGTVRLQYDEQSIDNILGSLPFAQRGEVAIDLGNEEEENNPQYSQLSIYTSEASYIRSKYPGVSITVGGWRLNGIYNQASDGAPYVPIEDFISAHIYYGSKDTLSAAVVSADVLNYLQTVNTWSSGKPIMMGEYGSASGAIAGEDQNPNTDPNNKTPCTTCTPDGQLATNTASLEGLVQAKQQGINAVGALVWSYFPRGILGAPAGNLSGSDNQYVLLVPDGNGGSGLPITTLPAAQAACPSTITCPGFPNSLVQQ